MKTLNLNKLTILLGLFLVSAFFTTGANALCTYTGDAITTASSTSPVTDSVRGAGDACSDTPDFYKLEFYKLGVCAVDPSENDLTSCQFLIDSAAGIEHVIEYPAVTEIDVPEFSIAPGSYPYMVAIFSNLLGIMHSFTTSTDTTGANGEGTFCWTHDARSSAYTNEPFVSSAHGLTTVADGVIMAECGDAAGVAVYTYEIINALTGETCSDGFAAKGDLMTMPETTLDGGAGKVGLLKTDDTYATACANAAKIIWTSIPAAPYIITANSSYDLKMRSVGAVSMDFSGSDNNEFIKTGADPVQLYLTIID